MTLRYFELSEFDQVGLPGSGEQFMDVRFLSNLDLLRHNYGHPIIVFSGYRCPEYNDRVSSTGPEGPHTTGKAGDLKVAAERSFLFMYHVMVMNHHSYMLTGEYAFTGIGVSQKGDDRYYHLDSIKNDINRPRIWSY